MSCCFSYVEILFQRMSSDDDEHGDLQKEYETLMEENQKLKNQTQKVL